MPPPSLAKRLLSPNDPLPLLISQDLTPELYDFIAISLRAYVSPWWSKISRYDKDLLPHITRILISVIRVLHSRTQALDIQSLVFCDVPPIITQHYRDYRNAASKTSTAYTGGALHISSLFFHLQPHIAILPNGSLEPEYYRQIVDHILKVCLPPEDYDPEPERLIVREIIVKLLLNDVIPKITQPWFIHKTILDFIGPPENPPYFTALPHSQSQPSLSSSSFSFHTLIVLVLSALQSFSGVCLALIHSYKQALNTIKRVHQSPPQPTSSTPTATPPEPEVFSTQTVSLPISASVTSLTSSSSSVPVLSTAPSSPTISHTTSFQQSQSHLDNDNYAQAPLAMISEISCSRDRFSSNIFFTTLSMIATSMIPFLDKLLPHLLSDFLSPALILTTIKTAKRTLFPNGYPGPPPVDPSPEEQAELRARLLAWRGKGGIGMLLSFS